MADAERGAGIVGDVWGGLAAMLVALPSALAYGVTSYAALGPAFTAQGATAGILGAIALGLIAPALGGAPRLITAPCAPAAAVMGALGADLAAGGDPDRALLLMTLATLLSGALQVVYGAARGGKLIKYIPYPVVAGYLSGAGLIIIVGQAPKLLGYPKTLALWQGLLAVGDWHWQGLSVGLLTMAAMALAPRITKKVPAAILGLAAGVLAYFGLGFFDRSLLALEHNKLVIGTLGSLDASFFRGLAGRWAALGALGWEDVQRLLRPALTLSVLLSIDTLKTSVVMDALTQSRHDSNRELIGQGAANLASAAIGGMPGAGTMGATLVSVTSGGATRRAGVFEGLFVLVAYLLLARLIAWIPVAALAGILMVVGFRMVDRSSFRLLQHRSTVFDFAVIAAVVATALWQGLITAAGVGLALAVILFIRDQMQGQVLRRKYRGDRASSKKRRLPDERARLERKGGEVMLCELQGNLFFGTTDQLLSQLEADLEGCTWLILDMRRVHSVDFSAAHMLEQVHGRLAKRGGCLIFAHIPASLPTGQDLNVYLKQLGLVRAGEAARTFDELSDALEWTEDRILEREGAPAREPERALALGEIDLLKGCSAETLADLGALMLEKSYQPGDMVFRSGESAEEIYLVRRGSVKVLVPLPGGKSLHLATFGQGDFFGDLTFLNPATHSAEAVAAEPTDLYIMSRSVFDAIAEGHHRMSHHFYTRLAQTLAVRLRHTDLELRALKEA